MDSQSLDGCYPIQLSCEIPNFLEARNRKGTESGLDGRPKSKWVGEGNLSILMDARVNVLINEISRKVRNEDALTRRMP